MSVRLVRARQPYRDGPGAEFGLLGHLEPEYVAEQVGHLVDVRPVEEGVVESVDAHAAGLLRPDIGVLETGVELGPFHLGVELDPVTARDDERDATTDARLIAGGDVLDVDAVGREIGGELFEGGLVQHLERHEVHARLIGLAEDHAVPVEFVPAFEVDATVVAGRDLVQAEPVAVVDDRIVHVENTDLDDAGSKNSVEGHGWVLLAGTAGRDGTG